MTQSLSDRQLIDYFKEKSALIESWLDRLLPAEDDPPEELHRAMRYSIFAGGKRLRPILTLATGEIFDAREDELFPAACAIEMIHTYSLIHDDLPAMDNDDLRRGRPTNHVVYGEAMAILSGDALLTHAFQILANYQSSNSDRKVRVISEIASAAGSSHALIGGQVLDLQSEGKIVDEETLEKIHRAKTGALISCAVRIGAIVGGAGEDEFNALTEYGEKAGLAFQVADDLLDEIATSDELGKTAGKDASKKKATYTALYGIKGAKHLAERLSGDAISAAHRLARDPGRLPEIARFIVERRS
ncbi:MAG: polyprenyl synthetase family protein [Acidobacteria bacterium]|nr:polyprenyl synthetase family protein [Acidobacteriota bacterium]